MLLELNAELLDLAEQDSSLTTESSDVELERAC